MNKKLLAGLLTLGSLIALYGLLFVYYNYQRIDMPQASNGTLDLQGWNWKDKGVVRLDGEWELYRGRLLGAGERIPSMSEREDSRHIVQVPGSWTSDKDARGLATYRLLLRVDQTDAVFGIKISSVQMANRLIINGQALGESGNPAADDSYSSLNKPYVSYFIPKPGWNEIRIQVANADFKASSGIQESIVFGHADQIAGLREWAVVRDWIVITGFLIMGLYFIGLFTQRRKDTSHIVFGVVCLFIALYTSLRGERVLLHAVGELPFWLFYRLQIASAFSVGIGFLLYVYTTFRPYCSRQLIRWGVATGAVFLLINIGFASQLTSEPWRLTTSYSTFSLIYATYVFVLAALHRVAGSAYLVAAALALNVMQLASNVNVYFGAPLYLLPPIEPFLILLMLALWMSLRFSNAFYKIEDLSEQLLETDKLKDDFLARTSHEFKTPLHGIMNISRSMLDGNVSSQAAQKEKLELISDIARRLSQLVYDILDLSKLKRGELRLAPMPIDVSGIVKMQLRFYSYLSTDKQLQLVNELPAGLPPAMADESRVSQIISNLLDNAIKHTEHGSVTISGEVRHNQLAISVRDTGIGIAEQDIPLIFEPFKSLAQSGRESVGLGLSITKQLVELQGGELTVASTLGVGTTFTFSLPVAQHHEMPAVIRSYEAIAPREPEYSFVTPYHENGDGNYTILVVDDQYINLKILLDALDRPEYHIIAVKDGFEALAQFEQGGRIDLVVLDLMMPGMSGYEVCQHIRKRYSLLELPVLMVTAAIQPQNKVEAFRAGANDYLPKPFDLEELRARIGSLLAMKASHGRALRMEMAFLQSQIKPHFLFNTLNSIVASSYRDVDRARRTIVELAEYLRTCFRFSNTEEQVALSEELDLIGTYVAIERVRFRGRIRFECEVEESAYGVCLPPLSLQPLVENAIRHGMSDHCEAITINVSVRRRGELWEFRVADDGIGMAPERLEALLDTDMAETRQGVGLLNIDQRLMYTYGCRLQVASERGQGTVVAFSIPAAVQ